jgi:hypothetical protein
MDSQSHAPATNVFNHDLPRSANGFYGHDYSSINLNSFTTGVPVMRSFVTAISS